MMYEALAAGDKQTIEAICCEGLRDTLLARIAKRKLGEKWEWSLEEKKGVKIVSHRAADVEENCGYRQVVVRIKSRQSLVRKMNGNEKLGKKDEREKAVAKDEKDKRAERWITEYVVIQKKTMDGVDMPWMIWGTTKETTIEQIEEEEMKKKADLEA